MAKDVGVQPGAVVVQLRPWERSQDRGGTGQGSWGCSQGLWVLGQDCGGTARGRGGVAKAVRVQTGAWQGRTGADRGVAKTVGVPSGAVKMWSWPCGCIQGTWGRG